MNPTDQATPLTQESEALLGHLSAHWPERGRKRMREVVAAALPAIEAAAARRAIEGSGVVEALRLVFVAHDGACALVRYPGWGGPDPQPPDPCTCGKDQVDAALAALPRPDVDGKQPCANCGHDLRWHTDGSCDCEGAGDAGLCPCPRPEEPRAERKVAKDIEAAVDELERLFHPEGRCAECGGGKPYWKHDMGTYSDHPEAHPFTPEAR